ncbi:MAG: hypothetical protein IPJ65_25230 [Archangiaceae bacterium]|nr:hypothetical protein [Archangiaceae bacterium]
MPAVGLRGVAGVELLLIRPLRLGVDFAVEGYVNNPVGYRGLAAIAGLTAGWAFF